MPDSHERAVEVRTERLCKSFGAHLVLRDINVSIQAGDIVAIVGGSGSGKTVLLDHMVGLIAPDEGQVLVADHDAPLDDRGFPPLVELGSLDDDALDRIRLHWSVVFQRNALFSGSVRDNIALWLREHTPLSEPVIEARVRSSLAAVSLDVKDVLNKDRDALSGGMAKRVAIARAIAADPIVMFYDEPTTGLDPVAGASIHELIWRMHGLPLGQLIDGSSCGERMALNPSGSMAKPAPTVRTSILVTHDKELLRRLRPRVVMLHKTHVCFDGPYDEFERSELPPAHEYLAAMPVLHAREAEWDTQA